MSNEEQMAGTGADREKLAGALETVFEVLGGDRIEAILNLVSELEHRLSGSITSVSEQSTTATDGVRNDLTARIDEAFGKLDGLSGKLDSVSARLGELDERHKSSHDSLEKRIGKSTADLDKQLKESVSVAEDRIRALKNELGTDFASKEEHINKELDTLGGRNLTGIQLEFGQHTRATERMSIVLDGLATVLKGDPPPPPAAEVAREDAAQHAAAAPQEATLDPSTAAEADVNDEILDNALERVFSSNRTHGRGVSPPPVRYHGFTVAPAAPRDTRVEVYR